MLAKNLSVDCCRSAAPPKRRGTLVVGAPATTGWLLRSVMGRASQSHEGCDASPGGKRRLVLRLAVEARHPRSWRVLKSSARMVVRRERRRAGECVGRRGKKVDDNFRCRRRTDVFTALPRTSGTVRAWQCRRRKIRCTMLILRAYHR
jgi:hypothetical protein